MELNLQGKRALVGGASKGIGKAIAHELANLGASVTAVARSEELLGQVVDELPQAQGQNHSYLVLDYSKPDEVGEKVSSHLASVGTIHILVNNTGGPPGGPAHQAEPQAYTEAFTMHLVCNQVLLQTLLSGMKESGYGRIINVISTSVKQPIPGLGVSNTIRGGVANWAKTLSNELGPFGITVNNILPGATETQRLDSIVANKAAKTGQSKEETAKAMKEGIPMRRFGKPEELAAAAAFLASPAAGYINGINVPVDGGRTSSL